MEPAQIAGKIFCGDPPAVTNKPLEAGVTVVDVLDMEFAANAFTGRLVERFVADTQGGSTRRIAGAPIGHQQCILVHDRRENLPQSGSIDRRQDGTNGRAGAICRDQNRHLLIGQAPLCCLAPALSGLSVRLFCRGFAFRGPCPNTIPFAAFKKIGFVGLDNALQFFGGGFDPGKEAVSPAKGGAPGYATALCRRLYSYIVLMLIPARALARQCLGVGFFCRTMRWNQRR